MPSAPSAPIIPLGRPGTKVEAWNRSDLIPHPKPSDLKPFWHPQQIIRSAGAQAVDCIVAEFDLKASDERWRGDTVPQPAAVAAQMTAATAKGQYPATVLGWGVKAFPVMKLDRNTESLAVNFRQERFLFGVPLGGMKFADLVAQKQANLGSTPPPYVAAYQSDLEIVFNPTIRLKGGQLPVMMGNMDSGNRDSCLDDAGDPQCVDPDNVGLFIDPLAMQTLAANVELDTSAVEWFLEDAVSYLCWACNPKEKHFQNPLVGTMRVAVFQNEVPFANRLRNHRIRRGLYLPEALDELLTPYGYSWFTKPLDQPVFESDPTLSDDENDEAQAAADDAWAEGAQWCIVVFQRGKGQQRTVKLQAPGLLPVGLDPGLEIEKSNVASAGLKYDIVGLANKIKAYGSRKQIECTIELYPCWPDSEDGTDPFDVLILDRDGAALNPHVFRTFAANEAGDYAGLRPEISEHLDLFDVLLDSPVVRRRKLLPCISREIDPTSDIKQRSRGILVEWYNTQPDPDDSLPDPDAPRWERMHGFDVANDEILIHFNGESVPDEIAEGFRVHAQWVVDGKIGVEPDLPRIRVTATIEDDVCILAVADKLAESPQASEIVLTLDVSDRFHSRTVKQTGPFKSELRATLDPDTIDDQDKLQDYVERIRSVEDCARLEFSVVLEGLLHPDLQISDLVTTIDGRGIDLNANSPTQGTPRYPQIMRIEYDVAEQRTTLDMELWSDLSRAQQMHG